MSLALLLARIVIGFGLAAHGAQKLFGWYGGYGTKGTGEFMASIGFTAGVPMAVLAGFGEFVGGGLTGLGFLGPIGPALIIAVMTTAILTIHLKNGWFASKNGVEFPLTVAAGSLVIAFSGPGTFSLDWLFGFGGGWTTTNTWMVVLAGAAGGAAATAMRKQS